MSEELIEEIARAMCRTGGLDPDFTRANDDPRWKYYVPLVDAIIPIITRERIAAAEAMREACLIAAREGPDYSWIIHNVRALDAKTVLEGLSHD